MPHYTRHTALRSAFTLVELVTVLLVFGILSAVAVPTFTGSLMYHRLEAAALRLKNDLQLARQTALAKSTTYSLEFTSATAYTIPNLPSLDHADPPYQVDLAVSPYGVQVPSVDFAGATSVSFNGYGLPSSAGAVVVRAGNHQRQIELDALGNVIVSSQ